MGELVGHYAVPAGGFALVWVLLKIGFRRLFLGGLFLFWVGVWAVVAFVLAWPLLEYLGLADTRWALLFPGLGAFAAAPWGAVDWWKSR